MAQVLIVKAHPLDESQSYSLRALKQFVQAYQEAHPNDSLTYIDVYDPQLPVLDKALLEAQKSAKKGLPLSQQERELLTRFDAYTQQFLDADKIVIANPLWNLQVPSHLVAWVNSIAVVGKTFTYTKDGPVGLAKEKKLLHIQANGGVYNGADPASNYIRSVFAFLGLTDIQSVYIEGHAYAPQEAEAILQAAVEELTNLAQTF